MLLRNRLKVVAQGAYASVFVLAGSAHAEKDLNSAIDAAANDLRSTIAKLFGVPAIILAAVSLGMALFWFWRKDPRAIQYVRGTLTGGVVLGVASILISP